VLSYYYVKQLAAKASAAKEPLAAAISNYATYSNAPASARRQASNKYTASIYNICLSIHYLA